MFFFFFKAEDGIRDVAVTGVQTCALPISSPPPRALQKLAALPHTTPPPLDVSSFFFPHGLQKDFTERILSPSPSHFHSLSALVERPPFGLVPIDVQAVFARFVYFSFSSFLRAAARPQIP